MNDCELTVAVDGHELAATLTLPLGGITGGLVPLHPASDPSRRQLLFDHLAETLPPCGIAVLRYDRRDAEGEGDVPFAAQAADALVALDLLSERLGGGEAPLGLWGWSQGAWAAPLAAALSARVSFLVLLASTGVSPAEQMRYGTAEQLRRAGHGEEALGELADLRAALEDHLREGGDPARAQSIVDRYIERPWFPLAYVPSVVPEEVEWVDMDFDPEPVFAQVRCPVLLFYGETDEWTPIEASIATWRRASRESGNDAIEIVRLPGTDHSPTLGGRLEAAAISPQYARKLVGWLERQLGANG